MPDEALVHERLQRVELRACDVLSRSDRAPATKDGEAGEAALLFHVQEIVGPLDRGPQRLLSRVRVATAAEEIEPLG